MKRAILIAISVLAAQAVAIAHAAAPSLTVVLAGGSGPSTIAIELSEDGRSYVIDSAVPLEVGGDVCANPAGNSNELICVAAPIGGFEVNSGAGEDDVTVSREVAIPVTLRGGPGDDRLTGGAGADKLVGGPGDDNLVGRAGGDSLFGGPGDDALMGGPGDDMVRGGPGEDDSEGGSGHNELIP
jgi:Ca2+-binding RTX toxin-like protein